MNEQDDYFKVAQQIMRIKHINSSASKEDMIHNPCEETASVFIKQQAICIHCTKQRMVTCDRHFAVRLFTTSQQLVSRNSILCGNKLTYSALGVVKEDTHSDERFSAF